MPAVSAVLCLERENIVYTVGVNHFTADPNAQRTGEHLRHTKKQHTVRYFVVPFAYLQPKSAYNFRRN